ncbi:putative xyloglucan endotransglucosylase/hydrolase protein 28 [Dichanthelium oligosanthes]|uniref:Xyloglucan endotransglucosylase/hydrolase n=1 Tax=Dichanthelium oligosanthes TaxID=888268 RepID=A0A1E5V806_9POAL|nr:putative xyloglucan endotransglucosylase/hydrolase protein 28 [Dichanthelium oligosanthes]
MATGAAALLALMMVSWAAVLAANAAAPSLDTSPVPFEAGYMPLFGGDNLVRSPDGRSVRLKLDASTGSGFVSKSAYHHGYFSASIKLPDDYTAGVVVAFYLSNGDVFPGNHDEVDFELLGSRRGHEWRLQTNIYGNGSTSRGREERYLLPFDPTLHPHAYAVAWTPTAIIFYVDGTPIREVVRVPAMGGDFPAKPMSVYATIWDGSAWATEGGRYKLDYAYAPFAADFSALVLSGCPVGGVEQVVGGGGGSSSSSSASCDVAVMTAESAVMTPAKRAAMRRFRRRHLLYTVCHDRYRYNGTVFPECDADGSERGDFHKWGESKLVSPSRRGYKKKRQQQRANKQAAGDRPSTWPIGTLLVD